MPARGGAAIARQISDALEAAHEKGIIHRDLKPANIKIKSDGIGQSAGFRSREIGDRWRSAGARRRRRQCPWPEVKGVILGTAAYMSPEQARGQAIDKRADIWAFGVVLYEMVCGRRAIREGHIYGHTGGGG